MTRTNQSEDHLKEISARLETGVREVFTSERYRDYLKTMSKFHQYSVNNTILIYLQRPDATAVASYTRWKLLGRQVQKGERGIQIFCPCPYKRKQEKLDAVTKQPILGAGGKPLTEEVLIPAYKIGTVFDISQTEGKPLPMLIDDLQGNVPQFSDLFDAVKAAAPAPISFETIHGTAKGYFSIIENRIAIQNGLSEQQTLKTAIHETAHAMLDNAANSKNAAYPADRFSREVRAESIAFCVCSYYGIDTSDYSFSYIAGWSSNQDAQELKENLALIHTTSHEIIDRMERALGRSPMERKEVLKLSPFVLENTISTEKQEIHRTAKHRRTR